MKQLDDLLYLFLYHRKYPLPLPLGEVAEQSEDGEGKQIELVIQKSRFPHLAALGFAGLHSLSPTNPALRKKRHAFICRWQRHTAFSLSVACGDSSPRGRAKGLSPAT